MPAGSTDGFALIAVLWISVIIGGIALAASYAARLEMRRARYPLVEMQALGVALAGVETVKYELLRDATGYAALNGAWKTDAERYRDVCVGDGTLNVSVDDEESKINLNSFPRDLLKDFEPLRLAGNTGEMLDSLADWQDADNKSLPSGAEEDYYAVLDPPRHCKNAPLDCFDELQCIRGFDGIAEPGNLRHFVTVVSNGKVNVNTAPVEVLAVLPKMDRGTALKIVARRAGPDCTEGTADDRPFTGVDDLKGCIGDGTYTGISTYVTFVSATYTVRACGAVGSMTRIVEAVLEKAGKTVRIRSWREL